MAGMTTRDFSRYDSQGITEYEGVCEFLLDPTPRGALTIGYNGSPFDLLIREKEGANTTIILFHPAAVGATVTRPFFVGHGLADPLNANTVYVADPSLERSDALRIAWFAGNDRQSLQNDLPPILRHIVDSLSTSNVILYSASAGGFAAMYYATKIPGSIAVAINPQTDILGYGENFYTDYATVCWGATDKSTAVQLLQDKCSSDLKYTYSGKVENHVLYVQNKSDWHLRSHMEPFMESVRDRNRVASLVGEWGKGHVPPPTPMQTNILANAVECNGDWNSLYSKLGAVRPAGPEPIDSVCSN